MASLSLRRISSRLSDIQRLTLGSMLSGFTVQAGLLISGVLSSRILGPEDRGYLALLILMPIVVSQLGSLGLPIAVTYFVGKAPTRAGAIARSLGMPVVGQLLVLGTIQFLIVRHFTAGQSPDVQLAALLFMPLLPSWLVSEYGFALLQGQQRFRVLNVMRSWSYVLHAVILLGMSIAGIGGLPQVAASWLIVSCLQTITTVAVVARGLERVPPNDSDPSVKQMTRFGVQALIGAISPIETLRLDQVVVGAFLNPAAVGLYVTAASLTNLPRFTAQSIGVVAYPLVAAQAERVSAWRSTWRFFWFTLAISLIAASVIAAAADILIPLVFGPSFAGAVSVARVLLFAAALASGRRVLADGARGLGYPMLNTKVELVTWVLMIGSMLLLVDRLGLTGVALSLLVGAVSGLGLLIAGLLVVDRRGHPRALEPVREDLAGA